MPSISQPYDIYRGDTWKSQKYVFIEEEIPPGITEEELIKGIEDGTYTALNFNDYEISADVYIGEDLWFTLTDYMITGWEGNYIAFNMTAQETQDLYDKIATPPPVFGQQTAPYADSPRSGKYDIQFCEKATGTVTTAWDGTLTISPDITKRTPC